MAVQSSDGNRSSSRIGGPGPTLFEHCQNILSLDIAIDDAIVTGSSKGSICIHNATKTMKSFKAECFRWTQVQQVDVQGPIICALSDPCEDTRDFQVIASGGSDGIVSIWEVGRSQEPSIRNELFDKFCYSPDWPAHEKDSKEWDFDVQSIKSIITDQSLDDVIPGNTQPNTSSNNQDEGDRNGTGKEEARGEGGENNPRNHLIELVKQLKRSHAIEAHRLGLVEKRLEVAQGQTKQARESITCVQACVDDIGNEVQSIGGNVRSQGLVIDEVLDSLSRFDF